MGSRVQIRDEHELKEFVRTHLGHRLTAMVAPLCVPEPDRFWCGRNDAYRAAKEGSYVMLRMFIEFLGVKSTWSEPDASGARALVLGAVETPRDADTLLVDSFECRGTKQVSPEQFDLERDFIARMHRTLCKINAHFTYDDQSPEKKYYDRIASPDDKDWARAVDIVVQKLDEYFYSVVGEEIVVHLDLEKPFIDHYKTRLGLRSDVRGDGLGRPPGP